MGDRKRCLMAFETQDGAKILVDFEQLGTIIGILNR